MDSEAIIILNEIKTALYVLVAIVTAGVVANWIRAGISVKNLVRKELDDAFIVVAKEYYDEGKYDELIGYCKDQLKGKPNHAFALWYEAKAYYQKREHIKSKECFELLAKAEPSWDESHVQPYLNKIMAIENENR